MVLCGDLDPFPVESDIPVGQLLDKPHQTGNHSVETIHCRAKYISPNLLINAGKSLTLHLLLNKRDEGLSEGKDPPVHGILGGKIG